MKASKFGSVLLSAVLLLLTLAPSVNVFAHDSVEETDEFKGARCIAVTNRVNNLVTRFEANKERHVENYKKRKDSVENFLQRITAKGLDTAKLESDLATYDQLVSDYANSYVEFINLLKEAQEFKCGESDGKFAEKVQAARAQMKVVHEKGKAVREFMTGTIQPDLQDIREQGSEKRRQRSL